MVVQVQQRIPRVYVVLLFEAPRPCASTFHGLAATLRPVPLAGRLCCELRLAKRALNDFGLLYAIQDIRGYLRRRPKHSPQQTYTPRFRPRGQEKYHRIPQSPGGTPPKLG